MVCKLRYFRLLIVRKMENYAVEYFITQSFDLRSKRTISYLFAVRDGHPQSV